MNRANQDKRASQDQQGFADSLEQRDSRDNLDGREVPVLLVTPDHLERRGHWVLRELLEQ